MAKESDQTRWVGIRPTDPPEDIPITLDAEVPHIVVDAGGGGNPSVGSLKLLWSYNNPSIINNWYTVADIAGAGTIQLIGLFNHPINIPAF